MAASDATVKQILDVFSRHLSSQDKVKDLVKDLYKSVNGNKSVMQTLKKLREKVGT